MRSLTFAVLFLGLAVSAFAQTSPFQSGGPAPASSSRVQMGQEGARSPGTESDIRKESLPFYVVWFSYLIDLQKDFQFGLSHTMRDIVKDPWSPALWTLLLFSFLYGVLHVLLPGHQKSVIGAYFLSENARYGQGFLVGGLFSLFHAVSVIVILLILRVVLQFAAGTSLNAAVQILQAVAVVGMILVSLVLVVRRLGQWREVARLADLDGMRKRLSFDWHERLKTSYEPVPWRRLLPFLFFAAVLPCPGSLLVLLFALGLGTPVLGLVSVGAISLGMAVTLTILSLAIIAVKSSGRSFVRSGGGRITMLFVEVLSLAALMVFGILLWPTSPA